MFFEMYFLSSYNHQLQNMLLIDCECYKIYKNEATFIEEIIYNRKSYMACICYESKARKRINHKTVPIVLGSYLDYRIRGKLALIASRGQWGAVILKGVLKIYTSFSTFDALSMHVRESKKEKSIDWFTYVEGNGLALSYKDKVLHWTYNYEVSNNLQSNDWIRLLNKSNPFTQRPILASEYLRMFNIILEYPYNMNDLKNRQFLNGATIIKKYIHYDLNKRQKKNGAGCIKMSKAFETGALFQALSKKNTYETEEWCKNYPQTYDNTLHEGRSNKTAHFLPNVTRASNDAVRNSKALAFPADAINFFCMLNTKDLKSAGEQNVLADFVIMTEKTDCKKLHAYLNSISTPGNGDCLVIDGYMTECTKLWELKDLLALKRIHPHVTTKYYHPFVIFSTRASIPIKYSDFHDVYFSPAETTHYRIKYPEADMLSITAKELNVICLRKTPAAKTTVTINNIKGSVAMITSSLHEKLMRNSLGVTCYMDATEDQIKGLIDFAVISDGHDTAAFERIYATLREKFNLDAPTTPVTETSKKKAINSLLKMYDSSELLTECKRGSNTPYVKERTPSSATFVGDYLSTILNAKHYKPPNIWNLKLRAVFGNPYGACIEDGVVIHSGILEHIPPIYYNACITIDFSFKTAKQPKDARIVGIDEKRGDIKNESLIGCMISEHEAYVKNSKHSQIKVSKIGSHFYYLIHFLPKKTQMYEHLKIRHIKSGNTITVIVTGQHKARVDVGSKVANSFGQKNVISLKTDDLKDCWGITRNGKKVHAQIVYSDVSIIGRIPSGQLYDMLKSDELALGPNGEIIAPVDLVIHALHPYTNIKLFDVKVDTLTNINGFDSQNLPSVSLALRSEPVCEKVLQVLGLHGFNIKFDSTDPDSNLLTYTALEELELTPFPLSQKKMTHLEPENNSRSFPRDPSTSNATGEIKRAKYK